MLTNIEIRKLIPHRYPFLLVDKVLEVEPGKKCVAIKNVTANEPFFQGHFPQMPIMPGVLIVEALAQTSGIAVSMLEQKPEAESSANDGANLSSEADKLAEPNKSDGSDNTNLAGEAKKLAEPNKTDGLDNTNLSGKANKLQEPSNKAGKLGLFTGINSMKFREQVVPGDTLKLEAEILTYRRGLAKVRVKATVEDKVAAEGEISFFMVDIEE